MRSFQVERVNANKCGICGAIKKDSEKYMVQNYFYGILNNIKDI